METGHGFLKVSSADWKVDKRNSNYFIKYYFQIIAKEVSCEVHCFIYLNSTSI